MGQQIHKNPERQETEPGPDAQPDAAKDASGKITTDEIDAILSDIDEVLEENAAEFVAKFQQRGGE